MISEFVGFKKVNEIDFNEIPDEKGVYLVLYKGSPEFLDESVGGHFKGKNPSVSKELLESSWIQNEEIIYIGQAGGNGSKATLRKRLKQYIKFGSGKPIGHWGGRYIWQLKGYAELIFAWKATTDDPYDVESKMIEEFRSKCGNRPFANLTK